MLEGVYLAHFVANRKFFHIYGGWGSSMAKVKKKGAAKKGSIDLMAPPSKPKKVKVKQKGKK